MDLAEVASVVRWAVGARKGQASSLSQRDQDDPDNAVVWVPLETLMAATDRDFRLDFDGTGGPNARAGRVDRAREHWETGGFMDPPLINVFGPQVHFVDGRHRLVAAHALGERVGPVVIPQAELTDLKRLVPVVSRRRPLTDS